MKIFKTAMQWLILIAIIIGFYFFVKYLTPIRLNLNHIEVLGLALSIAFMWVEVLKWGVIKPFNCLRCMTGWFSLIIGCMAAGWAGMFYLPAGIFIGAFFDRIKIRYL